jgi:cell division transport system ATP-binding protein
MDTPIISLKDVTISHEEGPLLTHVNLCINPGEFVYLIGKSGAGKTSLLRTLYADREIDAGEAHVCDFDLVHLKRREIPLLRRRIGIVFQNFRLLRDRNVHDNLAFVLKATGWKNKDERKERIEEVLDSVGMLEKKNKMPHELSGGEQQRVAIARALLNHPKIIIADEPTGNLDPETAGNIVTLLKNISQKGTAIVMTTHNMPMLDRFPGIVYRCKDGNLIDVTINYNKLDLSEDSEES